MKKFAVSVVIASAMALAACSGAATEEAAAEGAEAAEAGAEAAAEGAEAAAEGAAAGWCW